MKPSCKPQSIWAPRAALMAAMHTSQLYYGDAIVELEKFLDKYKIIQEEIMLSIY